MCYMDMVAKMIFSYFTSLQISIYLYHNNEAYKIADILHHSTWIHFSVMFKRELKDQEFRVENDPLPRIYRS